MGTVWRRQTVTLPVNTTWRTTRATINTAARPHHATTTRHRKTGETGEAILTPPVVAFDATHRTIAALAQHYRHALAPTARGPADINPEDAYAR